MKNTNKLAELMSSLTVKEKQYLAHYVQWHNQGRKDIGYWNLYNALKDEPYRSDAELRKAYKNAGFTSNLKYNRHYLYKIICQSLTTLRGNNNVRMQLKEQLAVVHALLDREMLTHAEQVLRPILKEAERLDYFSELLEAKNLQLGIQSRVFKIENSGDILQTIDDIKELHKQESYFLELRKMYYQLALDARDGKQENAETRKALLKQYAHLKVLPEFKHRSLKLLYNYHATHGLLYFKLGDAEKKIFHMLAAVDVFEQNKEFREINYRNYLVALSNSLRAAAVSENKTVYNRLQQTIAKLKYPDAESHMWGINLLLTGRLINAVINDDEEDALQIIDRQVADAVPFLKKEDRGVQLELYHTMAMTYFIFGDLNACEKWLNEILNNSWKEHWHFIASANVMRAIINAEAGNFTILPGIVLAAKRSLKKKETNSEASSALLTMLLRFEKLDKKSRLQAWVDFNKAYPPDKHPAILTIFHFEKWIARRIA